jgi:predicted RNA-binding protein YlqC (UPF0109 family)
LTFSFSANIWSQIQAAKAARERLEVVEIRITVQAHEIGFVIGKGGKQIQGLEQLSSCRIKLHQNEVVVTGSRNCVEKARALLAYTLETLKEQVCILSCLCAGLSCGSWHELFTGFRQNDQM